MSHEPPPELLAAARALGARSAGIAAFSMPAGTSEALGTTPAALADLDAGAAAGEAAESGSRAARAPTRWRVFCRQGQPRVSFPFYTPITQHDEQIEGEKRLVGRSAHASATSRTATRA